MCCRCRSFWWPWRCNGAIQTVPPNVACPGLHQKPLNTTIGQLLSLYCPCGRQGDIKQNNDKKCTNFAVCFDGRGGAPVWYCMHRPMEEVHGFPRSHCMPPLGKHLLPITSIGHINASFLMFFIVNSMKKGLREFSPNGWVNVLFVGIVTLILRV